MSLENLLAQAAAAGAVEIARAPRDGRVGWAYLSTATTTPLAQWLDRYAPFQAVSNTFLTRGRAAEVVLSSSAAIYLTDRAITFGPAAVAASFHKVMAGSAATHASVVVVKGVSANAIIEVAAGVTVEPIDGLLDVPERAHAFAVASQFCRDGGVPTAIVSRVHAAPTYLPRPAGPNPFPPHDPLPFPPLQAALDAISLVAGAAVVTDVSYEVVEEVGWPTMITSGIGGSHQLQIGIQLTPEQSRPMRELALLLTGHSRGDALTRALQKLRDAQRRTNDAERALDLGACLEILLMHGESAENTEIGYKLRLRAAWLIGNSVAERQRIHDLVKWAYNARSKVAHTGVLPPPKTLPETQERQRQLSEIEQLCRTLIAKVVKEGWPNWIGIVLQG